MARVRKSKLRFAEWKGWPYPLIRKLTLGELYPKMSSSRARRMFYWRWRAVVRRWERDDKLSKDRGNWLRFCRPCGHTIRRPEPLQFELMACHQRFCLQCHARRLATMFQRHEIFREEELDVVSWGPARMAVDHTIRATTQAARFQLHRAWATDAPWVAFTQIDPIIDSDRKRILAGFELTIYLASTKLRTEPRPGLLPGRHVERLPISAALRGLAYRNSWAELNYTGCTQLGSALATVRASFSRSPSVKKGC